ncbi:MAG: hypothetical protein LBG15_14370 [Dysgonamonadaceae bacterium]|jgi:hypothetical protein|nr:hypothetical protein [Dysgonamonadaceae bacterium]
MKIKSFQDVPTFSKTEDFQDISHFNSFLIVQPATGNRERVIHVFLLIYIAYGERRALTGRESAKGR